MQLNYYVLGQRIQKIRKRKRISQSMLSAMIGKSPGYISYLERGTKTMSLETFVNIANALEVSTDKLLNRELAVASEISNREAQKIFASCTPYETYVLLDIMKTTVEALRAHHHHLAERDW